MYRKTISNLVTNIFIESYMFHLIIAFMCSIIVLLKHHYSSYLDKYELLHKHKYKHKSLVSIKKHTKMNIKELKLNKYFKKNNVLNIEYQQNV